MTGQFKSRAWQTEPEHLYQKKTKKGIRILKSIFLLIIIGAVGFIGITKYLLYVDEKDEDEFNSTFIDVDVVDGTLVAPSTSVDESITDDSQSSIEKPVEPVLPGKINFDSLKRINPECVAWLSIEGTHIDNPVVQTTDNEKYLKCAFTGESNLVGTAFLDYRIDVSNGKALVIYGHHYKNTDKLFTDLLKYNEDEFYEEHPVISLETPDAGLSYWRIFSVSQISSKSSSDIQRFYKLAFESENEYMDYLKTMQSASMYETGTELSKDSRVLVLSTCAADNSNRLVVCAIEEK